MIRAPLFAEPCGDRSGWYIADAEMRDVLGVIYISGKRLLALWNALPGVEKQTKVGDRDTRLQRTRAGFMSKPASRTSAMPSSTFYHK